MNNKREENYELLRIICAIAVICIHISAKYVLRYNSTNGVNVSDFELYFVNAFGVFGLFSVPCFVMISGAFSLNKVENSDYAFYVRHIIKRNGIHIFVFSVLYFIFSEIVMYYKGDMMAPLKDLLKGNPYYHMWYVYMMIPIWLITPFIVEIKKMLGEKNFEKLAWIWFIFAAISNMTSNYNTKWNMGLSCNFLGYYLVGNVIYSNSRKDNKKGLIYIIMGVIIEIVALIFRIIQIRGGIENPFINYYLFNGWFSPFYLFSSIFIFLGFSMLSIRKQFSKIAKYMFYVYLFHAGILSVIQIIIYDELQIGYSNVTIIPLFVIIVFTCSLICSIVYDKVYRKIKSS